MIVLNEIAGFVSRINYFFSSWRRWARQVGRGRGPAAVGLEGAVYGGDDFGKDVGVGLESLVNGAVDERPEFFFERRVSGVGGNQDGFMVFGESGEALLMLGRAAGFLALEKNGGGELDPVPVEREVGDG